MNLPEMGVNINGDLGLKEWRSQPLTQNLTLDEKREVARRANVYPKLIAYLAKRLSTINDGSDEGAEIARLVREGSPEPELWQKLNVLSHRFAFDGPEARTLCEASRIIKSGASADGTANTKEKL